MFKSYNLLPKKAQKTVIVANEVFYCYIFCRVGNLNAEFLATNKILVSNAKDNILSIHLHFMTFNGQWHPIFNVNFVQAWLR